MYNSKQEIFDKVWQHFITNNNPPGFNSVEKGCCYNTETGGCAIGCLLSKEDAQTLDNYSDGRFPLTVAGAVDIYPEIIYKYISNQVDTSFLTDLQVAHDTSVYHENGVLVNFRHMLTIRLTTLADKHFLSVPFVSVLGKE